MNAIKYQHLAMRTKICDEQIDMLNHGVFGLTSEAGEVAGILQKVYQGHGSPLEDPEVKDHMVKELGDCLWMIAEICQALGVGMNQVMKTNIDKLSKRYPDGFDPEKSLHRAEGDI